MNDNSAASHDLVVARPHMGRVTGGGGAGPALASTEKRGTSRELISSGIPSSRLKDLEKEPSFGEVLAAVMSADASPCISSALAFSIPRRRSAIPGTPKAEKDSRVGGAGAWYQLGRGKLLGKIMFGKSSQTCAECAECAELGSALLLSPLRHAPHRTSAPPGSHLHTSNEQGPSHPFGAE